MLRNMICTILLAVNATQALSALALRTERNAMCGVEIYQERRDSICGVELYFEKRSSACEVERYNSAKNGSICGFGPGSAFCRKGSIIEKGDTLVCSDGNRPVYSVVEKTCENKAFGVASYKLCRNSSHGIELYAACRHVSFGVELYKSCSFYKTPEEVDAYIDATNQTLLNNSILLPAKQSDLFTTFRQEASFICLVDKYNAMPGYEDVVGDLTKKFFETFGYEYNESSLTCADASTEDRTYKITAGSLDCNNFDINTIRTATKPTEMVQAVFTRWKSTCTTKVTYDYLVGWFDDRLGEVNLLFGDIVARNDATRKQRLDELKQSISDAK